jgi:RNA polymerase sigma-70 factor (ECF subfamily)
MMAAAGVPDGLDEVTKPELDRVTLERCRAGEPGALHAFVLCYERAVFALLSRMLGRGPDVEDLAQETFLRAFRALPGFDPDGPARPSTWLLTIAARLGIDRSRRRRTSFDPPDDAASGDHRSPELDAGRSELRAAIAKAVQALPIDQRNAFVLAEFHDFSLAEVAALLAVPENTVKTRLFRAREKLSRALADFGGNHDRS